MSTPSWLERSLIGLVDAIAEVYKTVVFEIFNFFGKITTAFWVVVLFITRNMDSYWKQRSSIGVREEKPVAEKREFIVASRSRSTPFVDLCDVGGGSSGGDLTDLEERMRIPNARKSPSSVLTQESHADTFESDSQRTTTGLLEDLRLAILMAIDSSFLSIKKGLHWLFHTSYTSIAITLILTVPMALLLILFRAVYQLVGICFRGRRAANDAVVNVLESTVERRPIKEVVQRAGYPFERYQVITKDGYVLRLDRLPNKQSKLAVYLQHGVFDNSFAWVSSGTQSLAYRLHDLGYDVWLGNLRGTACSDKNKRHVRDISSREYWNFTLNEHAMYDFPANFQRIRLVKSEEEGVADYKLTVVSHSLGAAVTMMYLVYRKMGLTSGQEDGGHEDGIVGAIVLSPAGVHEFHTKMIYFMVPLIELLLFFLPLYVFKAPSRSIGTLVTKLWEDVKQTPTTRFILGLFTAFLLGGEAENHPIHSLKQQNVFEGTSVMIYRHFVQIWRNQFQGFDYGMEKNMKVYGTPTPPTMLPNYKLIDVPVHFVLGKHDSLIPPGNIRRHYEALRKAHPELASLSEFDTGHLEFTVGLKDENIVEMSKMIAEIFEKAQ